MVAFSKFRNQRARQVLRGDGLPRLITDLNAFIRNRNYQPKLKTDVDAWTPRQSYAALKMSTEQFSRELNNSDLD